MGANPTDTVSPPPPTLDQALAERQYDVDDPIEAERRRLVGALDRESRLQCLRAGLLGLPFGLAAGICCSLARTHNLAGPVWVIASGLALTVLDVVERRRPHGDMGLWRRLCERRLGGHVLGCSEGVVGGLVVLTPLWVCGLLAAVAGIGWWLWIVLGSGRELVIR